MKSILEKCSVRHDETQAGLNGAMDSMAQLENQAQRTRPYNSGLAVLQEVDWLWLRSLCLDMPGMVALLLQYFLLRLRAHSALVVAREGSAGTNVVVEAVAEIIGSLEMLSEVLLCKRYISVKDILKRQKKDSKKNLPKPSETFSVEGTCAALQKVLQVGIIC